MRWQHLTDDGPPALPLALPDAVVRRFDTPGFAGMTFYEVRAKSIINRVPGSSSYLPFEWTINPYRGCGHACTYCLGGDTPILMADGRTKPLAGLKVGDRVYGTIRDGNYRRYEPTEVLAHWSTIKPAYRVTLEDGTELIASGDHRFLTNRGWRRVIRLAPSHRLVGTGQFAEQPKHSDDYQLGYRLGARNLAGWPASVTGEWMRGFLAGVFDAAGTHDRSRVAISSRDPELCCEVGLALHRLGFTYTVQYHPDGLRTLRLVGGLRERLRFFHTVDPAITRKRTIDGVAIKSDAKLGVASVEPLGIDLPLYDITTGTGDFIANGVVSHNCFARKTHTYLDLDAGADFDSQVIVKVNAGELLRRELAAPGWRGDPIAMGTNVDCYQRAEGRYRLMREVLAGLRDFANPFSILTKGTLILRDLDLLRQAAEVTDVRLAVSIGFVDEPLWRSVEPGTPSPRRRLDMVRQLSDAGFPVGVLMAPILPGLTDDDASIDATVAAIVAAGAARLTPLVLHLRPGAREWYGQWLAREHPELAPRYRQLYGRGSYAPKDYQRAIAARVRLAARRHGLAPPSGRDSPAAHRNPVSRPTVEQPTLW